MRLLLDADLSQRRIGEALHERGHDVRALAGDSRFEGFEDSLVMELAAREDRTLLTRNSRDFVPILREWAESGREHSGAILIWALDNDEYSAIVTGVERLLAERPRPEQWRDLTLTL